MNGSITREQATAMVYAAALIWSSASTAGVMLTDKGTLNEDVNGADTVAAAHGQFAQPSDVTPAATTIHLRSYLIPTAQ